MTQCQVVVTLAVCRYFFFFFKPCKQPSRLMLKQRDSLSRPMDPREDACASFSLKHQERLLIPFWFPSVRTHPDVSFLTHVPACWWQIGPQTRRHAHAGHYLPLCCEVCTVWRENESPELQSCDVVRLSILECHPSRHTHGDMERTPALTRSAARG